MAEKRQKSEGDEMESFLEELERQQEVRDIAGWESGFPNLSRALNGILPGLHLLIGAPGCGKTSFTKQLLDQVAMYNSVPAIFFTFSERKKELRIRTLARLSGLENREIRRGSAYLLHWYGVPKRLDSESDRLPPSWEKLKTAAAEAKSWLNLIHLFECGHETPFAQIEDQISSVRDSRNRAMVVIDDCQRLDSQLELRHRLPIIAERLQDMAVRLDVALFAVWPALDGNQQPRAWVEKVPRVDVLLVMENDRQETGQLTESNRAVYLHVAKNREGETASLRLDFYPGLAKFVELPQT